MAAAANPKSKGIHPVSINDGGLSRAETPQAAHVNAVCPRKRIKIIRYDGAKVYEFLSQAALVEIQWQDLEKTRSIETKLSDQKKRAAYRAEELYQEFLQGCGKGSTGASKFLEQQKEQMKVRLERSQVILESLQKENVGHQMVLSEIKFAAQTVKSAATTAIAGLGLALVGGEAVIGAGVALGYDLIVEGIRKLGSPDEKHASAIVITFPQIVSNDTAALAGAAKQHNLEKLAELKKATLKFPKKSSIYRDAVAGGGRLDKLLKTLGWISLGITVYSEFKEVRSSWEEVQQAQRAYANMK